MTKAERMAREIPERTEMLGQLLDLAREEGRKEEREACAKVADHIEETLKKFGYPAGCGGFGNIIRFRDEMPNPKVLAKIICERGA